MNDFPKIFFHIFVLAGLALSPLYGVLSKEPNFFLAHSSEPVDFFLMIGMISFVFPIVIALIVSLILYPLTKNKVFFEGVFVAPLAVIVLLPFVKNVMGESVFGSILAAMLIGLAFSFFYGNFKVPKYFLNYISPAILVFPTLFLFEPKIFVLAVPEYTEADYPKISIPSNTPVVFILFDEFPLAPILDKGLNIDAQAFPNFNRLSKISYWYRNASTNYAFTGPSIRSVLTGMWQDNSRFGTYKYFPNNLFTLLGNNYQVEAHESALRLCPPTICLIHQGSKETESNEIFWKDIAAIYLNLILPQPKSFNVPGVSQGYKNFWGRENTVSNEKVSFVRKDFVIPFLAPEFKQRQVDGREDIYEHFLESLNSNTGKNFFFLHILYPHNPYRFLSSGKKYDLSGEFDNIGMNEEHPKGGMWSNNTALISFQNQKLINQLGYTDYLVGKLLDRLEETNLLDPSLFILAADHGVSIKEGGFRREIGVKSLGDIASIPLFIKLPGQEEGTISDLPATLLDVLPTLKDVLGVEVPWELAGNSLLNYPSGTRERIIHDSIIRPFPVSSDLKKSLLDGVKRKQALFGKFEGWEKFRLYDEKGRSFMDKPVSEFVTQSMSNIEVQLDSGSHIETKPGFLPAIVQGKITGIDDKAKWTILIAVNNIFRAVSPITNIDDRDSILSLLPEIAFQEGANEVDIYLISNDPEKGGKVFKPQQD